jgi:RNA polymerase sigma-54 factor
VGAKDLKECILLQYEARGIRDPILEDLLNTQFELLMKGAFKEIAKKTGFPLELVKKAFEMIKTFDPKPGRNYSNEFVVYVVPDVYVVRGEEGFEVFLGDDNIPELRLSRYYFELYTSKGVSENTKRYLKKKIKQAEWFISSIKQRQKTLLSVSKSIVKFQEEFFEEGPKALRPLVLRDVARDVGVHESTVSRVTSNKYMATPHGIFELKFFFPTGIDSNKGESLSTNIIKDMILRYIEEEDKEAPLTDDAIVAMLKERYNIKIARRTVAKYRELLNIPSSRERKYLRG